MSTDAVTVILGEMKDAYLKMGQNPKADGTFVLGALCAIEQMQRHVADLSREARGEETDV